MRNTGENHSHEKVLSGVYGLFLFTLNKKANPQQRMTLDSVHINTVKIQSGSLPMLKMHTILFEKSMNLRKKKKKA